uniref:Galactose mutarotase n=1 Tax=Caenorhabditis japonica TaxID=281687 RepID=A0A8R1DWZ1_CAEJA
MLTEFIEIANKQGLTATLLPFGATLAKLTFPDKNGKNQDLVLGFDTIDEFKKDTASLGKTVGRVANRIRDAKLIFDGKSYELEKNNGEHFLHGGSKGLGYKTWEVVRHAPQSVSFSVRIDESEDGLPGDAKVDVTYTINDRNQLIIEHHATCHKPGLLALTNHSYWNLDGSEDVTEHFLEMNSEEYVEIDETYCPTGAIRDSKNSQLDFRQGKMLKKAGQEGQILDLDSDLVIAKNELTPATHLRLWSEKSGIELSITTSYPVIHLYASKFLDVVGKKEEHYKPNKALAVEPQFHSAAPNFVRF